MILNLLNPEDYAERLKTEGDPTARCAIVTRTGGAMHITSSKLVCTQQLWNGETPYIAALTVPLGSVPQSFYDDEAPKFTARAVQIEELGITVKRGQWTLTSEF